MLSVRQKPPLPGLAGRGKGILLMHRHTPQAAYVHIPFCLSKCFYCDFNSHAGFEDRHDEYVSALILDIESTALDQPSPISKLDTVYFGGGTPTALKALALARVLAALKAAYGLADDAEVTVEANPDTVTLAGMHALRSFGFNRISLGAQSFCDNLLQRMGRRHDSARTVQAVKEAREAGFDNLGLDLIFALPGETLEEWRSDLDLTLELRPQHISVYELTIEDGTPYGEALRRGDITPADEDIRISMYETAIEQLTAAGYEHYEVSNFALPGFKSRHNTTYWHNRSYYGFGAGASGFVDGVRFRRISDPIQYIQVVSLREDPNECSETLTPEQRLGETLMLRLRLLEGIDLREFEAENGVDLSKHFAAVIDKLVAKGLLQPPGTHLRLTHSGLLLLNDVATAFMPDEIPSS